MQWESFPDAVHDS